MATEFEQSFQFYCSSAICWSILLNHRALVLFYVTFCIFKRWKEHLRTQKGGLENGGYRWRVYRGFRGSEAQVIKGVQGRGGSGEGDIFCLFIVFPFLFLRRFKYAWIGNTTVPFRDLSRRVDYSRRCSKGQRTWGHACKFSIVFEDDALSYYSVVYDDALSHCSLHGLPTCR